PLASGGDFVLQDAVGDGPAILAGTLPRLGRQSRPRLLADAGADDHHGLAVGVVAVRVRWRPDRLTHANPVDRPRRRRSSRRRGWRGWSCCWRCRSGAFTGSASPSARARIARRFVMPDQFAVLDLRVIDGAAGRLRQRIARPELPRELAVLDFDHRDRLGVRGTVEEHALEVVADLLHFEKVDQVTVGSGAGKVPSSDERVLLSRSDNISRGQYSDDDGELRAHESIPLLAGPGSAQPAQRAQIIAARAGGQLTEEKVVRPRTPSI